jgi:hypothetical protein
MGRALWLLVFVLGAAGCPKGGGVPVDSGSAVADDRPADLGLTGPERRALRATLRARLDHLRAADPDAAGVARLEGALALLDSWDAIAASDGAPRDKERDALAATGAWLERQPEHEPVTEAAEDGPVLPDEGPWWRAVQAHAKGELESALDWGLEALRQLTDAGIDSASLRYRLGEWAMERGDGRLAAKLFDDAVVVEAGQEWIADEAPLQAVRARNLELGPDGAALAEAQLLAESGRFGEAEVALSELLASGSDADVLRRADGLRVTVLADASDHALRTLARVDQILAGPGPYDSARSLLDTIDALPPGTWDTNEKLRLEGWYRNRTGATTEAERRAEETEQAATLQDARDLVVAGEFRSALRAYAKLDGTSLRATARKEAREAAETLVRQERERAGELFVAARKLRDPGEKRSALQTVEAILAGLIEEFPDSAYVDRLRTNLEAVRAELRAI